jgi:GTP1/Obg family GTP-binding protein
MNIQIDTDKFNEALHHITKAIYILQEIRDKFLESIEIEESKDKEEIFHDIK